MKAFVLSHILASEGDYDHYTPIAVVLGNSLEEVIGRLEATRERPDFDEIRITLPKKVIEKLDVTPEDKELIYRTGGTLIREVPALA